jgi:hypothetical protein
MQEVVGEPLMEGFWGLDRVELADEEEEEEEESARTIVNMSGLDCFLENILLGLGESAPRRIVLVGFGCFAGLLPAETNQCTSV